ncbi:MAG: hypothetical protein ABIJ14_03670 [Nanoarchaeota archaeon]
MNKKIATLIAGVLLISIVSAGLLTHFAVITGSVTVEGPVFYATSGEGTPGSLKINEKGTGTTYTISGYDERRFITNELGEEIDFYAPELKLSVEASLVNGTIPKKLDLEFGYYTESVDGTYYPFCNVEINVTSEALQIYSDICNGNSADNLKGFYYSIKGRSTGDVKISVKTTNQETKVEVLGVAT